MGVLELLIMRKRHADTFSRRNTSYVVVQGFTAPPKRDAEQGQGGIEELRTIKTTQLQLPSITELLIFCCVVCLLITIFYYQYELSFRDELHPELQLPGWVKLYRKKQHFALTVV